MTLKACLFAPMTAPSAAAGDPAAAPGAAPRDAFRWVLAVEASRQTGSGPEALAEALEGRELDELLLVVPGEDVLATRVSVPARARRQFEAALPYVVEEHLAEDVDGLHLASARTGTGPAAVRVLRPAVLDAALDALTEAGLAPTGARVDVDALPAPGEDAIEVWLDAERALIRAPDTSLAVPRTDLLAVLQALLGERGEDGPGFLQLRVHTVDDEDEALDLAQLRPLLAAAETPVEPDIVPLGARSLDEAVTAGLFGAAGSGAPELLTGRWQVRRPGSGRWTRWRLVAGLAVVWLVVQIGMDVGRAVWLDARADALRADSVARFRQIFPDRTRIPDPRRELEALVGQGGGGDGTLLGLLGVFGAAVGSVDEPIELRSLDWNAARGDLSIELSAPGIASVDRLKAALEQAGCPVTIDSAVQEARGVRARVRLRQGAEA